MSNSIVRRGSRNGHCEQVQYDDVQAYVPPDRQGSKDDLRSATNPYYGKTESLHYDHEETLLWKDHVKERYETDRAGLCTNSIKSKILLWFITFLVGATCGMVALFVSGSVRRLSEWKFALFYDLIEQEKEGAVPAGCAFAILLLINVFFGSVAFVMVYMEPVSGGSGIPEIKCYLNGLNIPRVLRFKTLVYKVVGIIMSCSSGLPVGKEGSMVHAGAVVAGVLSQGNSKFLRCKSPFSSQQELRNDKEKRDFVSCGAAAGVAAAFGSPIGGVLFSLEEGASFWSTNLTLRCFFCGSCAVFILLVYKTADSLLGHSQSVAMFSFGEFFSLHSNRSNFAVWELSLFIVLGVMGGFIGSIFNIMQDKVFKIRLNFRKPVFKYIEVVFLVSLMTLVAYGLPAMWDKCTPIPTVILGRRGSEQEMDLRHKLVPLYCPTGTHYNELASLYLVDPDTCIRQLYHFREEGDMKLEGGTSEYSFSAAALFLFFFPYIVTTCITFGSSIPAGSFVPSLLSGAAFGRLMGHLLHQVDNVRGTFADSGTYALMGSAAITGGITRLTISLVVVILEATGDMQYVLPLMLVIMSAVFVGKLIVPGLYDVYISNRELSFLEEEEMLDRDMRIHECSVSQIMTVEPLCVGTRITIENDSRYLSGSVSRKVLCVAISHQHKMGYDRSTESTLSWDDILRMYPKYPTVGELERIPTLDRNFVLDLTQLIDLAPFTINVKASVERAYKMFRTLGLRHVIVLNSRSEVVGIVARSELLETHLHCCIGDKRINSRRKNYDSKAYTYLSQVEMTSYDEDGDRERLVSDGAPRNSSNVAGGEKSHKKVRVENSNFFGQDDGI